MQPENKQGRPCEKCGTPIIFLKTALGKWMPVDAESFTPGDAIYQAPGHVSHYGTCPFAKSFGKHAQPKPPSHPQASKFAERNDSELAPTQARFDLGVGGDAARAGWGA